MFEVGLFDYDAASKSPARSSFPPASLPPAEAGFWPHRSSADWQELLAHTQTLRFRPDEIVLTQGSTNTSVFIVLAGEATTEAGASWTEGQAFGLTSFFGRRPVVAEIMARTDLEVARLTRSELDTILARTPSLALAITLELARLLALQGSP